MLRNILRTSRWLARRQINKFTPVIVSQYPTSVPVQAVATSYRHLASDTSKLQSDKNKEEEGEKLEPLVFEETCNETLESLCECFEELLDQADIKGADVTFSDGVLTVALGSHGTYVINRQSPNKQIWLSSPVSGPKRYDLVLKDGGYWVYKHDGITLHKLLQNELSKIIKGVDFSKCAHSLL